VDIAYPITLVAIILVFMRRDRYDGICRKHGCSLKIEPGSEYSYQYCEICEEETRKERL